MPSVTSLGHLGIYCQDLDRMRDFYSRFMGMAITDEDLDRAFASSAPTRRTNTTSWLLPSCPTAATRPSFCNRCRSS